MAWLRTERVIHDVEKGSNLDLLVRGFHGIANRLVDAVDGGLQAIALALSTPNDNSTEVQQKINQYSERIGKQGQDLQNAIDRQKGQYWTAFNGLSRTRLRLTTLQTTQQQPLSPSGSLPRKHDLPKRWLAARQQRAVAVKAAAEHRRRAQWQSSSTAKPTSRRAWGSLSSCSC
jgi:hypothetical protein